MARDTIEIRSHEERQLSSFIPTMLDHYESIDSDAANDVVSELSFLLGAFDSDAAGDVSEFDLGYDTWDAIATGLSQIDETRAEWLATKIARRAELNPQQMGFATGVPVGVLMTGNTATRS